MKIIPRATHYSIFSYDIFIYLTFWLLIFNPIIDVSSQEYTEFNFEEGIWVEEIYIKGDRISKQIYCKGDTTINEQSFHKLYESRIEIIMPLGYPDTTIHEYIGAIRENDSRQALFQSRFRTEPEIIYDFNLKIGDTIRLWAQYNIVDSIDSVEVCGKIRNRYWINGQSMHETLVEGVGFSNGLLGYEGGSSLEGESYRRLKCYTEKLNSLCSGCDLILGQKNIPAFFNIFPNPAKDIINISSKKTISSIEVLNLLGVMVHNSKNPNSTYHQIDLDEFMPGLYIVRIKFADKSSYSKLIRIE